eukprot:scaffold112060_cov13-Tisochrysis_lutea.AAC.1
MSRHRRIKGTNTCKQSQIGHKKLVRANVQQVHVFRHRRVKGINTCKQSQGITTQGKSAACQIKEDKEIGKSGHKEHKEDK